MKQYFKEFINSYKEFKRKKQLLKEQYKHLNSMVKEINELIRYSNSNPLDLLFEVNDRIDVINDFSKNLGIEYNIGEE